MRAVVAAASLAAAFTTGAAPQAQYAPVGTAAQAQYAAPMQPYVLPVLSPAEAPTPSVQGEAVPASVYAACGAAFGIAFAAASSRSGKLSATSRPRRAATARAVLAPRSAVTMTASQFETELGATAPLGYWDPLGLSTNATPEKFARWRAVEIKHGRIAMMATTGYIVQEFLRWPGYLSTSAGVKFADLPNGIGAWAGMPDAGKVQVIVGILLMEGITWPFFEANGPWYAPITARKVPEGKAPGDVAGDLWVRYTDPAEKAKKLNIELNNGRAAMLGITGMLMHDHITGSWIPPGF